MNSTSSKRKNNTTLTNGAFKKPRKTPTNALEEFELNSAKRQEITNEIDKVKRAFSTIKTAREALAYIKELFMSAQFHDLPAIIYLNQVYSLFKNRTEVDREIERMRLDNQIKMFKSDSKEFESDDIFICYTKDLQANVEALASASENKQYERVIKKYSEIILNETTEMFTKKRELMFKFKLSESDITALTQLGLLATKDAHDLWFTVPNVGKFRKTSLESRRQIVTLMRRRPFKELNLDELIKRNMKKPSMIGVPYLCLDLIGSGIVRRVNSPMNNFVIQLI